MRILLIVSMLFSLNAFSVDDKSMQELFKKYDSVMDQKKIELIDEVFSKKFITESGGRKELIDKIKELPSMLAVAKTEMTWKKGSKGETYFARVKDVSKNKKKDSSPVTEYVVIKEDGKLKIDGTVGDAE